MVFSVVSAGDFEGIDLNDARLQLRIPSNITAEDDLFRNYIKTAGKYLEERANIVLSTSTWAGWLDCWPDSQVITVNKNPVTSITSVEYYNTSNVLTAMVENTDYIVDTNSWPARIQLINTPDLYEVDGYTRVNAIKVTFVAGYSSLANVDPRAKHAIRLLVTECHSDRASYVKGNIVSELPRGFQTYANQLTIHEF